MFIIKNKEKVDIIKLKEISKISSGATPRRDVEKYWDKKEIPWMTSGEIHSKFLYDTKEYISLEGWNSINNKIFSKDTIMIALAGQGKTKGNVCYLKKDVSCNQSLAGITINENTNPLYVYYSLKNMYKELRGIVGEGREGLNLNHISNIKINLHNQKQQNLIANFLFKSEENINKIKHLLEKIEIRNQYYADKLLSGELSINEEGKIIKEIKEKSISFIENLITEYQKSKLDAKFGLKDGTYRFFKSSKEIYWSNDFIYDGEAVIMADGGKANVDYYNGKFSTSNHVYVFKSEKVNTKYLYYLLKSNMEKIEDCFQGAALKNLSKKQFKNLEIDIFENIDYQNNIVKFLDKLEDEKSKVERLLELEEKRFEWLSDKLLSGEYVIED